ncbi:threonine-phosphate decarboxylase CobD [Sedimenticola hydrogenitrophicus]|uniref:threonine-phosphate decarboxylase CobD n=1 Tax=Sedimenticola hydrogenitrophicus TaxID=2967975 RepID=UPI0021A3FC00|nr:threonine-phosphate decarboxylase CobD [Sedimenticola hydrogenitrophicus]
MLEHGGRLRAAAEAYRIPLEEWVDLSTGINPDGWVTPRPPDKVWRRLPEEEDGLEQAARLYYGCRSLLPAAGSQQAIQVLPALRPVSNVGVVEPCYGEHPHAWRYGNHRVRMIAADAIEGRIDELDVLVICNPNNPDGRVFTRSQLLAWHNRLSARGGWLVIDEAFMDATPEQSLAGVTPRAGLIILRSLGKFFGLAGVRVGFVLAETALLERIRVKLGPWSIAGPSRWVAIGALSDEAWQVRMRGELSLAGARLQTLLSRAGLKPTGGTLLFQYVKSAAADSIADRLARHGILVRHFPEQSAIRFGLPDGEPAWDRLADCLARRAE